MQDKEDLRGKDMLSNEPALSSTVVDVYITRTLYNNGRGNYESWTFVVTAHAGIGLSSKWSGGGVRLVLCSVALFGGKEMAHGKARLVRMCMSSGIGIGTTCDPTHSCQYGMCFFSLVNWNITTDFTVMSFHIYKSHYYALEHHQELQMRGNFQSWSSTQSP